MNPQFFPPLPRPVGPRFVPVIMRPTVPVAYSSFAQELPPPVHGAPLFPFCQSPDIVLDSPTTRKTRRDLEQLGRPAEHAADHPSPLHGARPLFPFGQNPDIAFDIQTTRKTRQDLEELGSPAEHAAEMIFELAAQKNGIRIGMDHRKGTVKQGDTLEDFKKLAERNGITVCPPGSKDQGASATTHIPAVSTSTPWCNITKASVCFSPSSVGDYYHPTSNEKHVNERQNASDTVNALGKSATVQMESDKSGCAKNKATTKDIQVEKETDSVFNKELTCTCTTETRTLVNKSTEPIQPVEKLTPNAQTATDLAVANKDSATNLEHALGACSSTLKEADPTVRQLTVKAQQDAEAGVEIKTKGGACAKESGSKSKAGNQENVIPAIPEEVKVKDDDKDNACDEGTAMENSEPVMECLDKDAQIAEFEGIARQKGIKVGTAANNKAFPFTSPSADEVPGNAQAENLDILNVVEEDAQMALFEEMAWLNGIKVGKDGIGRLLDTCSDSIESDATDNLQESEYWTETYPFEEDAQIARFQEIARLKGIKVNVVTPIGNWPNNSSGSSLSSASSDDCLCSCCECGNAKCHMVAKNKGENFEKLAKRNGIKIGVPADTVSADCSVPLNVNAPSFSINTATLVQSSGKASIVFSQAATQTEVTMVDCHSQTCGLVKQSIGVQVDVTKEAFKEEFEMWKLDENSTGDDEEMCYKELYFKERKDREELCESLQNEKDVSANTKHNHKRAMEQLKEELNSKTEETEKLKKDLKTVKRQKEAEVKRITKDVKSKEEELESTKGTLQLKDVALENLKSVLKDQTEKLKTLEDQLKEMKAALLEANNNAECKTCLNSRAENKDTKETNLEDGDGGWTVCTRRKLKSPPFKPTQVEKPQERPLHVSGKVDELCDIDLNSPSNSKRQCSADVRTAEGLQNGSSTRQHLPRPSPQVSSYASVLQSAEASRCSPLKKTLSPLMSSSVGRELRGTTALPSPPAPNSLVLSNYNQQVTSKQQCLPLKNTLTPLMSSNVGRELRGPSPPVPVSSFVSNGNQQVTAKQPIADVLKNTAMSSLAGAVSNSCSAVASSISAMPNLNSTVLNPTCSVPSSAAAVPSSATVVPNSTGTVPTSTAAMASSCNAVSSSTAATPPVPSSTHAVTISSDAVSCSTGVVQISAAAVPSPTGAVTNSTATMPTSAGVVTSSTAAVPISSDVAPSSTAVFPSSTGQRPLSAFHPVPPFPLQNIPTQVITQYLATLVAQSNNSPGSRVPNGCGLLRRPPGLNTEPVPEEEPEQASPPAPPAGKFTTFDKLMNALHKRFPNKNRQELFADLKKAKAASGAAGFKGMQICDVIKCVEDILKDKRES